MSILRFCIKTLKNLIIKLVLIVCPKKPSYMPQEIYIENLYSSYFSTPMYYFKSWCLHPTSILFFIFFIFINFILYWIYFLFFIYFFPHWLYIFYRYTYDGSISEIKPLNKHLKSTSLILHIAWFSTFFKAYVTSFSIFYKILFIWNRPFRVGDSYLNIFYSLLVLVFWLIIRTLTSLPRTVIIDSYRWSLNFRYPICYWVRIIKSGNIKWEFRCLFEGKVLYESIFDVVMPLSFLRIYRGGSSKWNFNPNNKGFYGLLEKGYNSNNVMTTLRSLSSDKQTYLAHLDRLRILNIHTNTTKIPHFTAFSEMGYTTKDDCIIRQFYGVNQTSKYSVDAISKIYILNAKKIPIYTRPIFFENSAEINNLGSVDSNDSRVMWGELKLYRLDYFLSSLEHKHFLTQKTLSLKKNNYYIDDYFSSFVGQVNEPEFIKSFESLDFLEKQSFITVLGNELTSYSTLNNVDQYLTNIESLGFTQFHK